MRVLKGIVLLLALANAGYFLYASGIATPPAGEPSTPAARLKLSTEPAASAATAPAPTAKAAAVRCVSVGPFAELAESAHAQATLHVGGYQPRQRAAQADITDATLVYLPLPAGAAAVLQLRRKLKGAGVTDAAEVAGPNDATVMSLGSFSDPQRAQARMAAMRQAGFAPLSLEHKHSGTVFWIDVDLKPTDGPLNPAELNGDAGHGAALEVRECPSPADAGAGAADASSAAAPAASAAR